MRGLGWLSGLLVGVALAALPAPGEEKAPAEATLQGEVVDLHCYLTRGARGSQHAGCANACIGRGVTPGFVAEDGRVFLLLAEKPFSAKDTVAGLAGETVRVRGTIVERDGVRGLQLKAAERVSGQVK
jgi:hypothetical protein